MNPQETWMSTNKQEIVKLLADLNQKQGTTIIMVTHDEQVAAQTQRMLYLSDGKIVKDKQAQSKPKEHDEE